MLGRFSGTFTRRETFILSNLPANDVTTMHNYPQPTFALVDGYSKSPRESTHLISRVTAESRED